MTTKLARGLGVVLFSVFSAQTALADLTAKDVWSEWRSYLESAGYTVAGSESATGNGLAVSGASLSMDLPDDSGTFVVDLGDVMLTENGDGSVKIGFPASIPMRITATGGENVDIEITYSQSGESMVVSGSPTDMTYDYTAAQADIALSSLTVDGEKATDDMARAVFTMTNIAANTQMQIGDLRSFVQSVTMATMSYDFAFADPDSGDKATMVGSYADVGFEGIGSMPLELNTDDLRAMMDAGFAVDGAFTFGAGNTDIQGSGDGEDFAFSSAAQGGKLGVVMNAKKLAYEIEQSATSINVTSGQLPFPVSMEMALAVFQLGIPLGVSDSDQDFNFALTMADFTMSDMLWSIFDSAAVLPRDPATVALDLVGKIRMKVDFLDTAAMENLGDAPPGDLMALTLNELLVSVVGAKLSGTGDFTFDNSDLTTFDGMPAPTGHVDLQLVGANGLLDKLIQMGFVQDEDAMGARMMMGMLAVPGNGEDTLNSKIEINGEGHIMANGQRIK